MPKCSYCGTTTKHLHTGGDARIPGDGVDDGACSNCEPRLATAARAKRDAKSAAATAKFIADQETDQ